MAALPSEIIAEILIRLPTKSLLRFSCVCKLWYSLFKTPKFIKLHLSRTLISKSDRHLLISDTSSIHSADVDLNPTHLSFSDIHHPLQPDALQFRGSSNGVVCYHDFLKNEVVIVNPFTNSHRKLQLSDVISDDYQIVDEWFYIGYDTRRDDYKVVMNVLKCKIEHDFFVDVKMYSVNNNSWTNIVNVPNVVFYQNSDSVVVDGSFHYFGSKRVGPPSEDWFIVCFNLYTESFSFLDCPVFEYDDEMFRIGKDLLELGGYLCIMYNIESPDFWLGSAELWVMKEYGDKQSWVRLFQICQPEDIGARSQIKPIDYSRDGRRILLWIDFKRFGWFDLNSNIFEECTAHGRPSGLEMVKCVGSLSLEDKPWLERGTMLMENEKEKNDLDSFLSSWL